MRHLIIRCLSVCLFGVASLSLSSTKGTAQGASDFYVDFMTMEGAHQAYSLLYISGKDSTTTSSGVGVEFRNMLSNLFSLTLNLSMLNRLDQDIANASVGAELVPIRLGPVALSIGGFGGVVDAWPDETRGDRRLVEFGVVSNLFVRLGSHVALGVGFIRSDVETRGIEDRILARFMFF